MKVDWDKLYAKTCDGAEWLHRAVARYIGGAIGWYWEKQDRIPIGLRYFVAFALMGWIAWSISAFIPNGFIEWASLSEAQTHLLERSGELQEGAKVSFMARFAFGACVVAMLTCWFRRRFAFRIIEVAYAAWLFVVLMAARFMYSAPNSMVALDYKVFDKLSRDAIWTAALGAFSFVAILAVLVMLSLALSSVRRRYGFKDEGRKSKAKCSVALVTPILVYAVARVVPVQEIMTSFNWREILFSWVQKDQETWVWIAEKLPWDAIMSGVVAVALFVAVVIAQAILAAILSMLFRRVEVRELGDGIGEKVVDQLSTGGADPRYRTSWYWAIFLVIFTLAAPFIIKGCGWEEPYGLVQGSGEPEVQVVKIKKIKKEKKKKKFILNAWSPYILERAKIDDKVLDEMLVETEDTYQADQPTKKSGKLGKGGGKSGGWPKGMENAKVRFIRLEYAGGDWDQDMGKGSDYNLLLKFKAITGFPIWKETESKAISRLSKFPKHYAPPFVFLTGSRGINVSASEVQELKRYLVDEGGMLFIDNGGGHFGNSVRQLLSRVFPGQGLTDIPNDDPIFQQPFVFSDGAPPFWHHDGTRAKCIRVGERIAVFYHPGDINDAWKDGHSGATPDVAEQAYRLGINVMYYAFNAYYARHFEGAVDAKQ